MLDIMSLLACLSQCLDTTTRRQLCRVIEAMLSMTGRVTMRGMVRWMDNGGRYRTGQRFFNPLQGAIPRSLLRRCAEPASF